MELKGQLKEDFEEWYCENIARKNRNITFAFYKLPPSMQWGVIVDFTDSKEIWIKIDYYDINEKQIFEYVINGEGQFGKFTCLYKDSGYKTRPEAREKAIEKLNEIYNESIN